MNEFETNIVRGVDSQPSLEASVITNRYLTDRIPDFDVSIYQIISLKSTEREK
jgi:hypothetical protein